jgi:hypothetical protein
MSPSSRMRKMKRNPKKAKRELTRTGLGLISLCRRTSTYYPLIAKYVL